MPQSAEREEIKLNVAVLVIKVWRRAIERGTDTECSCACCEGLAESNKERN